MIPETFTPKEITAIVAEINVAKNGLPEATPLTENGLSCLVADLDQVRIKLQNLFRHNAEEADVIELKAGFDALSTLQNKKIVYIEDDVRSLELGIQYLVLATRAKVIGIIPTYDDSLDSMVAKILAEAPDMILLDQELYPHCPDCFQGQDVAKALQDAGYTGVIIGASTGTDEFKSVGIKNIGKPRQAQKIVPIIAEYIARLSKNL